MQSPHDLIGFQRRAAERFLQIASPPDAREPLGLEAAFRAAFPVESPGGAASMQYLSYTLERPRWGMDECVRRGMTWAAPIKALLRLVHFGPPDRDGGRQIDNILEQEIYFGEIPLLTERGTCIASGVEKVLVARIERACGVAWIEQGRDLRITDAHHNGLLLRSDPGGHLTMELALDPATPPAAVLRFTGGPRTLHLTADGPALGLGDVLDGPPKARRDILGPDGRMLVRKGRALGRPALEQLRAAGCLGVPLSDRDVTALRAAADVVTAGGTLVLKQHTPLAKAALRQLSAHGVRAIPVASIYDAPALPGPVALDSPEALSQWFDAHVARFELTGAGRASIARLLGAELAGGPGPLSGGELAAVAQHLLAAPGSTRGAAPPAARLVAAADLLARQAWIGLHVQAADLRGRMAKARDLDQLMPHDLVNARPFMSALFGLITSSRHAQPLAQWNPLAAIEDLRRAVIVDPEVLEALGPVAVRSGGEPVIDLPLEARIDDNGMLTLEGDEATPLAAALVPIRGPGSAETLAAGVDALRRALPPIAPEAPPVLSGLEAEVARVSEAVLTAPCDGEVALADAEAIVLRPDDAIEPVVVRLRRWHAAWDRSVRNERPVIERGSRVRKGEVLAEGQGSAGGLLALGRNVVVGFADELAPGTVAVAERVVREGHFTSQETLVLDHVARDTRLGRQEITRAAISEEGEPLEGLDASGIVREGIAVAPGDVLVAMRSPLPPPGGYEDVSLRVPFAAGGIVRRVEIFSRRGADQDLAGREAWLAEARAALERERQAVVEALADAARRQGIDAAGEDYRQALDRIDARYEDEVWALQRGDDMPPGEIHRVRVVIERERALAVGDELRDGRGSGGRVVELRADERMPRLADGGLPDVLLAAPSGGGAAEPGGARWLMLLRA